jgi:hypothetical protein
VAVPLILLTALLAATGALTASPPTPTPGAPTPEVHVIDEKERVALQQTETVRLSLPTESDLAAWRSPGFRLQLGWGYAIVHGTGAAWSFRSENFLLRPSVRLDDRWALALDLLYGTGPNGVRWNVTLEPTFFIWRQLAVSAGVGFGGLYISQPGINTGTLPTETVSRTLSQSDRLDSCTGSALTSIARVEYLFVAGPLFASGPFAHVEAMWTDCQETFGQVDQETGRPIQLDQWWTQWTTTFGWWFAWR